MEEGSEEETPELDSSEMNIETQQRHPIENIFEYWDRVYTASWNKTSILH